MQLKDAVKSRKSIRHYTLKSPDWRKILKAIDYARFAPSAGGNFINKFLIISDEKQIKMLAEASQQEFVGDAKYVVVVISDKSALVRSYDERGEYYTPQQSGAAIQNFLLGLEEQKLSTTWVGYFYEDQIKRELKIPDKMKVEGIFPIGIERKVNTKEKKRTDLENILYFEKWGNKNMNS